MQIIFDDEEEIDSIEEYVGNITRVLVDLKLKPNLKGFHYLRKAIELCIEDYSYLRSVTTRLYPAVGKFYNVSPSLVERCIRNAIDKAYQEGGLLAVNTFYNMLVYSNDKKFTNSELIGIIVEKILNDISFLRYYYQQRALGISVARYRRQSDPVDEWKYF